MLSGLFEFLFKYRLAVFEEGEFTLGAPLPLILIVGGAIVLAVPAMTTYFRVRGKSSARDRVVLTAIRVALLTVVVGCLFRPMLLLSEAVPRRNFVGVLLDDSRSMRIADRGDRARADFVRDTLGESSALLARLRERFQVRLFKFGTSSARADSAGGLTFEDRETRLVDAVEAARQDLDAVPLSGLVVVSDGADNALTEVNDALLNLRARGVPVFTVGVGAERFQRDIEVQRVEVARQVLLGGTLVADVIVRQRGFDGDTVPLVVEDEGRIVASATVRMPAGTEAAPVRVTVRMTEPGPRVLAFRIPLQDREQVVENNAQRSLVTVRDNVERVLYVEGEPRYEVRFIRAAVEADSNVQVVLLQRTAEGKFLRLGVSTGDELVAGFPKTRAELYRYRGIILGSIEASFFSHDQLTMLSDFVSVRGGGLLLLGGRRSFSEGGYAGTPLADAMPVVVEGAAIADSLTFFSDLVASITPAGLGHAVTQIGTARVSTADRWPQMPPVTSVNRIRRVKPGAVVLLNGRMPQGGRAGEPGETLSGYEQPIVAYQRFGRGLVVAMPVQDDWQWKMHADIPVEDLTFDTFWRQMLRWITSDVPGRVSTRATPDQVNPRSSVQLRSVVLDSAYLRVNDAKVSAIVTAPSGAQQTLALDWAVDEDGEYRGSFVPSEEGVYRVSTKADMAYGAVGDETFIRSAPLDAEYTLAEMRRPLMQRIADETGGRFYTPETVGTLPEDIAMTKRGVTVINQMDLWDMPVIFLLLVGLASSEWVYRKVRGLA
ncbi:MAG: VWA domain-containing protein [Gemmatimonadetes bacterium]|nr:VWA domain-containing protein [Gemmatimonadota bacterium]